MEQQMEKEISSMSLSNSSLDRHTVIELEGEIIKEVNNLVKQGEPYYNAISKAHDIVSKRRKKHLGVIL